MRSALFSFWPEPRRGALTGFGPLSSARVCSGPKGLWPFVYDEANYFDPLATGKGARALVRAMKTQLKHFLFCWVPLMRNSFWQEILEPETQRGKFLTLTRMPRKTALIEPPVDDLSFEDFLGERLGAKSRKSLRYDQRKLAEQGDVAIETVDSLRRSGPSCPQPVWLKSNHGKARKGPVFIQFAANGVSFRVTSRIGQVGQGQGLGHAFG